MLFTRISKRQMQRNFSPNTEGVALPLSLKTAELKKQVKKKKDFKLKVIGPSSTMSGISDSKGVRYFGKVVVTCF